MVSGWPLGYFLGSIMYNTRELVKRNFYDKLEYKKISDKASPEAKELKHEMDANEDRIFTYYFLFYLVAFFLIMMEITISIWHNIYL